MGLPWRPLLPQTALFGTWAGYAIWISPSIPWELLGILLAPWAMWSALVLGLYTWPAHRAIEQLLDGFDQAGDPPTVLSDRYSWLGRRTISFQTVAGTWEVEATARKHGRRVELTLPGQDEPRTLVGDADDAGRILAAQGREVDAKAAWAAMRDQERAELEAFKARVHAHRWHISAGMLALAALLTLGSAWVRQSGAVGLPADLHTFLEVLGLLVGMLAGLFTGYQVLTLIGPDDVQPNSDELPGPSQAGAMTMGLGGMGFVPAILALASGQTLGASQLDLLLAGGGLGALALGALATPHSGATNTGLVLTGCVLGAGPWLLLPLPWYLKVFPFLIAAPALLVAGTSREVPDRAEILQEMEERQPE